MCGIAGILSWKGSDSEAVSRMVARLEHRGPDSSGFWGNSVYRAGMRRLSIVDLVGGDQPLYDETGRIVLFYNGEIYNSPELRRQLERDGARFRTHSDGEVICHLYRKCGRGLFEMLDGMFAVALWDDEKQTLILARDFPGEKPLYYSHLTGGGVAFASEIGSLLECKAVSRELDMQSIWDYPSFLWVPEPRTIYRSVRAVLPGEGMEISARGIIPFSFKEHIPTPDLAYETDEEAIASVRCVVTEAVKSRLLSEVPVGAFLSGGLDSSIVCAIARRELPELHTFCIGFEDTVDPYHGYSDESAQAESYAFKLGTKHTTIRVTAGEFRALLPGFLKAAGQPYAVSSGLGIMAIAKEARSRGVKVLLSGDGADEAFGGYSWYSSIPATFTTQPSIQAAARFVDGVGTVESRIKRMAGYEHPLRAWAWHYYASEEEKSSLFHHDLVKESSLRWFAAAQIEEPIDYIRSDRSFYFSNEMLSKVDRMTMAYSVEGRAPFAAPSVQNFSTRLPWQKLIRDGQLKWVLRQGFCADLPADVITRPKHGFNVPIDHWLKGEWNDLFQETFLENSPLHRKGILARGAYEYARQLLFDPGKVAGHTLFAFVMLNLWMKEYEN